MFYFYLQQNNGKYCMQVLNSWWQLAAGGGIAKVWTRAKRYCSALPLGRVAPPLVANCLLAVVFIHRNQ